MPDAVEALLDLGEFELAWTTYGVFDGFFERGLAPWDVAAGGCLVREAGGTVSDWAGEPDFLDGDILAGSPGVHAALLDVSAAAGT